MKCSKCRRNLPKSDFSWRNRAKEQRSSKCRRCHRQYTKEHYRDNKAKYVESAKAQRKKQRQAARSLVWSLLNGKSCVDCGEDDPVVLDFDHVDPETKTDSISRMTSNGCSLKTIKKEANKCEIRCANCHRRRTFVMNKWTRGRSPTAEATGSKPV